MSHPCQSALESEVQLGMAVALESVVEFGSSTPTRSLCQPNKLKKSLLSKYLPFFAMISAAASMSVKSRL